jgi:hypothetical protein
MTLPSGEAIVRGVYLSVGAWEDVLVQVSQTLCEEQCNEPAPVPYWWMFLRLRIVTLGIRIIVED